MKEATMERARALAMLLPNNQVIVGGKSLYQEWSDKIDDALRKGERTAEIKMMPTR